MNIWHDISEDRIFPTDFIAVIASALVPAAVTELILLAVGIVIILFARMVWKQNHEAAEN